MPDTKIVLITPPPINIPSPDDEAISVAEATNLNEEMKEQMGYRTYMSKKKYGERIMQIASEYEETGRVIGLDFWGHLVRARLQELGQDYDDEKLPGSGLYGASDFSEEYFTDGLHGWVPAPAMLRWKGRKVESYS